jgi:hypothetical protein
MPCLLSVRHLPFASPRLRPLFLAACLSNSGSVAASSGGGFSAALESTISVTNNAYVTMGFQDPNVLVYYDGEPVGTVAFPAGGLSVGPRSSVTITVSSNLTAASSPALAGCASDIATSGYCTLLFKGTVKPYYMGSPIPFWNADVQFQQRIQ